MVLDGNSHYYVMLNGDDTLYDCPIATVTDIVRYKEGDSVTLNFTSGGGNLVTVESVASGSSTQGSSQASA